MKYGLLSLIPVTILAVAVIIIAFKDVDRDQRIDNLEKVCYKLKSDLGVLNSYDRQSLEDFMQQSHDINVLLNNMVLSNKEEFLKLDIDNLSDEKMLMYYSTYQTLIAKVWQPNEGMTLKNATIMWLKMVQDNLKQVNELGIINE